MAKKYLKDSLSSFKEQIPVNHDLKIKLRKSLGDKKHPVWLMRYAALVSAAALICLALFTNLLAPIKKVNAAALKIANQISFVELGAGSSLGVAEYKGTIYMPVSGKGLFAYDKNGFYQLYDKEVNSVSVSGDGTKLILATPNGLSLYNLKTKKVGEILKGTDLVYYKDPSWSPDSKSIIYTKEVIESGETHGFKVVESGIYKFNMVSSQISKLADGNSPSFVLNTNTIVYEKENKIMLKNLKEGTETAIDNGRFPSVSPDGNYVAYVKTSRTEKKVSDSIIISTSLDNVWIADINLNSKKQVTTNIPYHFIDENDWLKNLKPDTVPQHLEYNGKFSYYDPAWSSDSKSLFTLKNYNTSENSGNIRLMRIDFTNDKLSPDDTVEKFLQALVVRDEDYAKSLMITPPPILTLSNPHPVGYNILNSGIVEGKYYVDAEIYSAYTAQPDYSIKKSRFYLSPSENGYIINRVEDKNGIEVISEDNNAIVLIKDENKITLFKESDIPAAFLPSGKHRLASLAYNQKTDTLVFSIQAMQDKNQTASVNILSYTLSSKQFKLIDHIETINNKLNIGISNLIVDPQGRYVAVDLFSDDDNTFKGYTYIYNLMDNAKTELSSVFNHSDYETISTSYWEETTLIFKIGSNNQTMSFIYNPENTQINSF